MEYPEDYWLAIRRLDPEAGLSYRDGDGWYVASCIIITDGPWADDIRILPGSGKRSPTPNEAIEEYWRILVTELPPNRYVHAGRCDERNLRWDGQDWANQSSI